jgi:hypothetical protein
MATSLDLFYSQVYPFPTWFHSIAYMYVIVNVEEGCHHTLLTQQLLLLYSRGT